MGNPAGQRTRTLLDRLRSRKGVSLLEVLVAVGVLLVAMALLAKLMVMGLTQSEAAQRHAKGILIAREIMEQILASDQDMVAWETAVKNEFTFDTSSQMYLCKEPERSGYRWQWQIEDAADRGRLNKVTVTVQWMRAGRRSVATYELRALMPAAANPPFPMRTRPEG